MKQFIKSVWWFYRANSHTGLLAVDRTSTMAEQALHNWSDPHNRDFKIEASNDNGLIATIMCKSDDVNAGADLDRICEKLGISREQVNYYLINSDSTNSYALGIAISNHQSINDAIDNYKTICNKSTSRNLPIPNLALVAAIGIQILGNEMLNNNVVQRFTLDGKY
jgi:hypothetical protein